MSPATANPSDEPPGLETLALPAGLELARTTPEFTAESTPPGLRSAHRVAEEVWGRLRVLEGSVVYVLESSGRSRTVLAGQAQVIEPGVEHHVEPSDDARFVVEFHRPLIT